MKKDLQPRSRQWIPGLFAILALLFFIGITIQVFIAGLAIFVDYSQWDFHKSFVVYFEFIPLVMLILAFFGGIPKMLRWHCFGLYMMVAMQYMTLGLSDSLPYLTALHPVIALVIFWRALVMVRTSTNLLRKK